MLIEDFETTYKKALFGNEFRQNHYLLHIGSDIKVLHLGWDSGIQHFAGLFYSLSQPT